MAQSDLSSVTREITLRSATAADAFDIASIHVRAWQAAYRGLVPDAYLASLSIEKRHAYWSEVLSNPLQDATKLTTTVAIEHDRVVGWVATSASRDKDNGAGWGEIQAIYLEPSVRRQGIGSRLTREALTALATAGYTHASLWVLSENTAARLFYERMGLAAEQASQKTFKLGEAELSEIRYAIALTG
ncbi:GNAT family N-acetyltransferase [Pararobbsia alpina]